MVKLGTLFLILKDGRDLAFATNYLELEDIEMDSPDATRILDPDTGERLPGTAVAV